MTYILTFKSTYEESAEYSHPKGYSICKFLEEQLRHCGFDVRALDNYRDIAWSLDCHIGGKQVFFFIGYLGTKLTDWQLVICSRMPFWARILGKNDQDARITLSREIHAILSRDTRFTDLKWFPKYTGTTRDVWYSEPCKLILK